MRTAAAAALTVTACALIGCMPQTHRHAMREENRSIELGKVEMVRALVEMKAGELKIRGGAGDLLEASLRYDERAKPEIRYDTSGFRGDLTVRQPHVSFNIGSSDSPNNWDLRLNDDVPMDLEVRVGAGKSVLELGSLYLRSLEVHLGAGEINLDLTGKWRKSMEARIRGGVGKAVVRLPKDVGIEARARGGIGSIHVSGLERSGDIYTNEPAVKSPVTLHLDIEGGVGEIRLEAQE